MLENSGTRKSHRKVGTNFLHAAFEQALFVNRISGVEKRFSEEIVSIMECLGWIVCQALIEARPDNLISAKPSREMR